MDLVLVTPYNGAMRNIIIVRWVTLFVCLVLSSSGLAANFLAVGDANSLSEMLKQIVVVVDDDDSLRSFGRIDKEFKGMMFLPVSLQRANVRPKVIGFDVGVDPNFLKQLLGFWKDTGLTIVEGVPPNGFGGDLRNEMEKATPANVTYAHVWASNMVRLPWGAKDAIGPLPLKQLVYGTLPMYNDRRPMLALQMLRAAGGDPVEVSAFDGLRFAEPCETGIRKIRFIDLFQGKVSLRELENKYVLVGTDKRLTDAFVDPHGHQFNGVFLHALALARLMQLQAKGE